MHLAPGPHAHAHAEQRLEDDCGDLSEEGRRRHLRSLGLLDGGDAGDEVHLFRLPYLCPLNELVPDPEHEKERDVDVYRRIERTSVRNYAFAQRTRKYAQEVRKLDALKFQKTVKPLMRMKIAIQNVPQ